MRRYKIILVKVCNKHNSKYFDSIYLLNVPKLSELIQNKADSKLIPCVRNNVLKFKNETPEKSSTGQELCKICLPQTKRISTKDISRILFVTYFPTKF